MRLVIAAALAAAPAFAAAETAPRVTTDIPPVHSLAAQVMEGVGTPSLILPPGASPHSHAMRPSEAAALAASDLVIWIGPDLTPWLDRALDGLAADAATLTLLEAPGTRQLAFREGATFEAHDHGDQGHDEDHAHDDHGHDDHGHDDHSHDDHGHEDHAHDDHAHDNHDHHDHAHDGVDPHAWLDPENARVWLGLIADALAEVDPANAATYRANAEAASVEIDTLMSEVATLVGPIQDKPFIVFHDAYHYFEARFGIEAAGAVSLGDATSPGPARLQEIRDTIAELKADCVFSEPQFEPALVATVIEGSGARTGMLDPVGAALEPGPGLYGVLIRSLAEDLSDCLSGDAS